MWMSTHTGFYKRNLQNVYCSLIYLHNIHFVLKHNTCKCNHIWCLSQLIMFYNELLKVIGLSLERIISFFSYFITSALIFFYLLLQSFALFYLHWNNFLSLSLVTANVVLRSLLWLQRFCILNMSCCQLALVGLQHVITSYPWRGASLIWYDFYN